MCTLCLNSIRPEVVYSGPLSSLCSRGELVEEGVTPKGAVSPLQWTTSIVLKNDSEMIFSLKLRKFSTQVFLCNLS